MAATSTSAWVNSPILRAESVRFGHQGADFLSIPELEVREGELMGLVGPNGSGKSTLLKVLAGLLRPQQGVVYICGRSVDRMKARERARLLAWVPQRAETPFEWTVTEMVAVGRHPHQEHSLGTRSVDESAVGQALAQVGLAPLAERSVSTLSGGEWQRALIARALAQEAKILLLDEPVANLDLGFQRQVYELIEHLRRSRGLAVIAADHHLELQSRFCDRLLLLDRGKVAAQGTPEEVFTRETLERVFRTPLRVEPDPQTGRPRVEWRFTTPADGAPGSSGDPA